MPLDQYQLCPCGGGKKIKFCCSKDSISELDKILRALEGEQRIAGLDQINRLIEDKGPRHFLLALKAEVQLQLEQYEEAAKTIAEFQKLAPYNPAALALSAALAAVEGDTAAAVEKLQQALEYADQKIPTVIYAATRVVGHALLSEGDVLAAQGHLMLQTSLSHGQDRGPSELLTRINTDRRIPLLLKADRHYAECPAGVPWFGEFNAAMNSARRGAWLAACESLDSLAEKVPDEPAIINNIGILRGWLGQTNAAISAWRKYSALPSVDEDSAVEVEALVQLLEDTAEETKRVEGVDSLIVRYSVTDTDRLLEQLVSHQQAEAIPAEALRSVVPEDEPPPQAAFWLLDRPAVHSNPEIELEQLPQFLGELLFYGKQTDREARLEFWVTSSDSETKQAIFTEVVGDLATDPEPAEKFNVLGRLDEALSWRHLVPRDVPLTRLRELVMAHKQKVLLETWPNLPQYILDGKTPREVAGDPEYRRRLLASILLMETVHSSELWSFDFNLLRDKLGLPRRLTIPFKQTDSAVRFPLNRLDLLDPTALSDEDLAIVFQRSLLKGHQRAVLRLGAEVLKREPLCDKLGKSEVYTALVAHSPDPELSLRYVDEARRQAVAEGSSPASWLMTELSLRFSLGHGEECQRLISTIHTRHLDEPGVADALYQILMRYGVINEDGQMAGEPAAEQAVLTGAPAPAPESGATKIWTPDSAAEPGGERQTKLWIPE